MLLFMIEKCRAGTLESARQGAVQIYDLVGAKWNEDAGTNLLCIN